MSRGASWSVRVVPGERAVVGRAAVEVNEADARVVPRHRQELADEQVPVRGEGRVDLLLDREEHGVQKPAALLRRERVVHVGDQHARPDREPVAVLEVAVDGAQELLVPRVAELRVGHCRDRSAGGQVDPAPPLDRRREEGAVHRMRGEQAVELADHLLDRAARSHAPVALGVAQARGHLAEVERERLPAFDELLALARGAPRLRVRQRRQDQVRPGERVDFPGVEVDEGGLDLAVDRGDEELVGRPVALVEQRCVDPPRALGEALELRELALPSHRRDVRELAAEARVAEPRGADGVAPQAVLPEVRGDVRELRVRRPTAVIDRRRLAPGYGEATGERRRTRGGARCGGGSCAPF